METAQLREILETQAKTLEGLLAQFKRPTGDPYGRDRPTTITNPGQGRGGEWVPRPGLPANYPHYLKPIPINTRDVLVELRQALHTREPRVVRMLYSTWNAQSDAIKDQEIRNAFRDGQMSPQQFIRWREQYNDFITNRMAPEWRNMAERGSTNMARYLDRGAVQRSVPFDRLERHVHNWIDNRGAELLVDVTDTQRRAVQETVRHFSTTEPVPPAELGRILRASIGVTPQQARAIQKYQQGLKDQGVPSARRAHLVGNYGTYLRRLRAERIARTELAYAFNYGQFHQVRESVNEGHIKGPVTKSWATAKDERVCGFCGPMDEVTIGLEETYPAVTKRVPVTFVPPAHPNCLLPGTRVGASVTGGLKAWYDGPAIEIETERGYRLAVTPGHPVMTPEGLRGAGELAKGDYVLSHTGDVWSLPLGEIDHQQCPPSVQDVFRALQIAGASGFTPTTVDDLHGDARFSQGDVHVVRANCQLLADVIAEAAQLFSYLQLPAAHVKDQALSGLGSLQKLFLGPDHPTGGQMGRFHLAFCTFGVLLQLSPLAKLRLGTPTELDPGSGHLAAQGSPADANFSGQLVDRFSGQIAADQVVQVRNVQWCGHVFDLEADEGWIVAEGIVTSNCRCSVVYSVEGGLEEQAEAGGGAKPEEPQKPPEETPPPSQDTGLWPPLTPAQQQALDARGIPRSYTPFTKLPEAQDYLESKFGVAFADPIRQSRGTHKRRLRNSSSIVGDEQWMANTWFRGNRMKASDQLAMLNEANGELTRLANLTGNPNIAHRTLLTSWRTDPGTMGSAYNGRISAVELTSGKTEPFGTFAFLAPRDTADIVRQNARATLRGYAVSIPNVSGRWSISSSARQVQKADIPTRTVREQMVPGRYMDVVEPTEAFIEQAASRSWRATFRHELGHRLQEFEPSDRLHRAYAEMVRETTDPKALEPYTRVRNPDGSIPTGTEWFRLNVSEYAGCGKWTESVSESFTWFTSDDYLPGTLPPTVERLCRGMIEETRSGDRRARR